MADLNVSSVPDVKEVTSALVSSLSDALGDKVAMLINLSKVLFVIVIIYFIVLIISKIYRIMDSRNLSKIALGVQEINTKLDSVIKKKEKKKIA